MLNRTTKSIFHAADQWSGVTIDSKSKLYKLHHFFLLSGGQNFNIEIQESPDGTFTAHADNTADPHDAVASTSASDLQSCLNALVQSIEARGKAS